MFVFFLEAQQDSVLYHKEVQLKNSLDKLRKAENNQEKEKYNNEFQLLLKETLLTKDVFSYPFSSLKTLGTIKSPDNTFRLFNWNVEMDDRSNQFFCYILKYDEKKKKYKIIELKDKSDLHLVQDQIVDENSWYGCLYYKIIPTEKNGKNIYTLLGWDGNSTVSNIKLIDALSFQGEHARFGSSIFKVKNNSFKRLCFEYSKRAFMSLNYDEKGQRIVMDHLSPESPNLEGFREYYVPDLSYDDMVFKNNKWNLREDVIGINNPNKEKTKTIQYANVNSKGEQTIVKKEIKDKWINPSDDQNPAGSSVHVAQLPEHIKEINSKENKPQEKEKTGRKRYKKNEFSMNPYLKKVKRK
ncbi:MAG: hypothetical protein HYU67_12825 [Flavobacteriia bacterium]|nr:hypothetical protein [Flavobacteriia bacterium]